MRSRGLILLAIIIGLIASIAFSQFLLKGAASGPPSVIASRNLSPGQILSADDMQVLPWPTAALPANAFSDPKKLIGRVVRLQISQGELLMATDLAPEGAQGGLASSIEFGKRAITVRVNDVIAVAGFAHPGSYVDVLVSAKDAKGDQFSKIVLHRVKVLAIAQETVTEPSKPKVVNAVTLELTPDEAEQLDLARSIGSVSLILRNEMDPKSLDSAGAKLDGITRNAKNTEKTDTPINRGGSVIEMRGIQQSTP